MFVGSGLVPLTVIKCDKLRGFGGRAPFVLIAASPRLLAGRRESIFESLSAEYRLSSLQVPHRE